MLLKESMDVYFDIHTKYKNKLCCNSHDFWECKPGKTWRKHCDFEEWLLSATGDQFSRIKTSKIRKANCFSNSLIIRFVEPFYVDVYIQVFLTTATDKDVPINRTPNTYLPATYRKWGMVWEWKWRDWTIEGSTSYFWVTKGFRETVAKSSQTMILIDFKVYSLIYLSSFACLKVRKRK